MRHASPKDCRERYGLFPNMARVPEEAERLQREARNGIRDSMVEGFMREFGVERAKAEEMARYDVVQRGER